MNLQEAILAALDFERKVRDHYLAGARDIADPHGRRVFATLGKEEQRHVDYLERCLAHWHKTGKVPDLPMGSGLPGGTRWIEEERARLSARTDRRAAPKSELDALRVALDYENETDTFYRRLVLGLPQQEQALFRKFLAVEDGHLALVRAQFEVVQDRGFWFDVSKFIGDG